MPQEAFGDNYAGCAGERNPFGFCVVAGITCDPEALTSSLTKRVEVIQGGGQSVTPRLAYWVVIEIDQLKLVSLPVPLPVHPHENVLLGIPYTQALSL